MTLEWIGAVLLLVVVLPVVDLPAARRAQRRQQHRAQRRPDRRRRRRPGPRTSTQCRSCSRRRSRSSKTIESAANYGGSLDVILDDA